MRKNISSIFTLISAITLFLVLFIGISTLVYADPYKGLSEDDSKILPVTLCAFFKVKCDNKTGVPDPNQPTPPYPTGEPYPTANPQITPPSGKCMPTYGPITCGPRSLPLPLGSTRACGHCGENYGKPLPDYCKPIDNMYVGPNAGGNAEAIDIGFGPLTSVPLPFIHGTSVIWYHKIGAFFADGSDKYAAFQEYVGTYNGKNPQDKKLYYVRYLHTQQGSGTPMGSSMPSGNEGAKVAAYWTKGGKKVPGNHVHIQIFDGKIERWVDATNFYCY
ncbi:MAG: hypothetical protein WBO77_04045 [Microgenomates group bacterium]